MKLLKSPPHKSNATTKFHILHSGVVCIINYFKFTTEHLQLRSILVGSDERKLFSSLKKE